VPTLHWQKSSYSSEGNNCLELAPSPLGTIHLRESDEPTVTLTLSGPSLSGLLRAARRTIPTAQAAPRTP
jgi:hypothetical protein